MAEHRAGNGGVIVVGQATDDVSGCLFYRCKTVAEFDQRLGLDLLDQRAQHLAEYRDLLVGVGVGSVDEECRDPFEGFSTLSGGAVSKPRFNFVVKGLGVGHGQMFSALETA